MTEILALLIYVKVHVNSKYFKMLLKTPKDTTLKLFRREQIFQDTLVHPETYTRGSAYATGPRAQTCCLMMAQRPKISMLVHATTISTFTATIHTIMGG